MVKRRAAPDFEQALGELEALVEKMERGDMALEESLQAFERGLVLTRTCQQALKDAEQKVRILLEKDGKAEIQPLDDEERPRQNDFVEEP